MIANAPFGAVERMLAIRYLFARREHGGLALISIVSVTGISMSVFALIVIMSIMNGFRIELLSRIIGFEAHILIDVAELEPENIASLVESLSLRSEINSIEPLINGQAMLSTGTTAQGVTVRGVRPEDIRANELVSGGIREGTLEGWGENEATIIIGGRLASTMRVGVAEYLRLVSANGPVTVFGVAPRAKTYRVSATFNVGNELYDRYMILMPIEQAALFFNYRNGVGQLGLRVQEPDIAAVLARDIARTEAAGLPVYDWQNMNAQYVSALKTERNVMRMIMMILVMITALNIITGLLMLVKNKTRDIAILRTIGVTRAGIVRIFLITGSTLGGIGVLAGLICGIGFVLNIDTIQQVLEMLFGVELFPKSVYMLDAVPARLQWSEISIVIGWAFLMSILTTLPPSLQAARLEPVEALRNQ